MVVVFFVSGGSGTTTDDVVGVVGWSESQTPYDFIKDT
jgi:hypothetical protein